MGSSSAGKERERKRNRERREKLEREMVVREFLERNRERGDF